MLTATSALDLLDAISLTETEAHFENPIIVEAENTQKPADGRHQPLAEVVPVVVHPAASARARRPLERAQEHIERVTVSQTPPNPQVGAAAHPAG